MCSWPRRGECACMRACVVGPEEVSVCVCVCVCSWPRRGECVCISIVDKIGSTSMVWSMVYLYAPLINIDICIYLYGLTHS